MLRGWAATDALLQLHECHSLSVGGSEYGFDDNAAAVMAQTTQLTHLSMSCRRGFTSKGLQCVTCLTNLQQLEITPVTFDDGDYKHSEMEKDLEIAVFGFDRGRRGLRTVLLTHEVSSNA